MTEKPITVGPKQFTPPICLGCYRYLSYDVQRSRYCSLLQLLLRFQTRYLNQKQDITNLYINFRNVDGSYRCGSCDWPLCGSKRCEKDSIHKTSGECDILSKCSYKVIIFIWIPYSIYEIHILDHSLRKSHFSHTESYIIA